ncbi:MAG TPA: MarR family transcriptional regulator [Acidimicrobiia bacterium]|nr:MarR family transcriptional regulator [Acidimicrobiia bacterium]
MSTDVTRSPGGGVPAGLGLNPQIIGQAENALRALLERTLASTGLAYRHWVALSVIAGSGTPVDESELVARIEGVLKADEVAARGVIADLRAADVVQPVPDNRSLIRLTDAGRALHRDVREAIGPIVSGLFRDIPADDLRTAGRVLTLVTDRADEALAGS